MSSKKKPIELAETSKRQGGTALAETSGTPATALTTHAPMLIGGKRFSAKVVTLPLMLVTEGQEVAIRIDGAMRRGSVERARVAADGTKEQPMMLAPVTVLETGELRNLICAKVIESALADNYPDDGYVGRMFAIRNNGKVQGKRHNAYTVAELVEDDAE